MECCIFFFHFFFNFTKWCKMFPLITDEKRNNFYVMIWREKKVQIYNQSENSCGNLLTATRMFNLLAVSVLHPSLHWSEPHDWDGFLDYSTNTKQVHHLASAAYLNNSVTSTWLNKLSYPKESPLSLIKLSLPHEIEMPKSKILKGNFKLISLVGD